MKLSQFCWGLELNKVVHFLAIYGLVMSVIGVTVAACLFDSEYRRLRGDLCWSYFSSVDETWMVCVLVYASPEKTTPKMLLELRK